MGWHHGVGCYCGMAFGIVLGCERDSGHCSVTATVVEVVMAVVSGSCNIGSVIEVAW